MRKKYIYSEEQKARNKIYKAKWYQENKEEHNQKSKAWNKKNPNYQKEWASQYDLGYWVVYLIHNFDGLGNIYCGQTQNIYTRMRWHKCKGKLNTETHEILEKFDNVDEALGFELTMHLNGYHGNNYNNLKQTNYEQKTD